MGPSPTSVRRDVPDEGSAPESNAAPGLLRFLTCGSVDDGKSTLIGRLLQGTDALTDRQRDGLLAGGDPAALLDGLAAEREQGITIDIAWRFFGTARRRFIVADCPGHEQYTRNMATGASTADLALVLVDARKGLLPQTRRHTRIAALMGIRQVILAVNKMDAIGHQVATFARIAEEYAAFAESLGITAVTCIPVSALHGENLVEPAAKAMPWYAGPTVIQALEHAPRIARTGGGVRLPVQWVCRPDQDFRGLAGTIAAGTLAVGDAIVALPSGRRSTVSGLTRAGVSADTATAGDAVMVTLADDLDIARGDVLAAANDAPAVADQFAAHLVWMDDAPLLPGRRYRLQCGARSVAASVSAVRHRVDPVTGEELAARTLELNEIGYCHLSLEGPLPFEPYARDRALGGFILVDRETNATVAAGMIDFALRRAANVHWQPLDQDRADRGPRLGQRAQVVWFTGLSGAGKSTLANEVERALHAQGRHAFILDGDNVRHGLNRDLGFSDVDRVENIRRVAEVARLMVDAGLIVLVSFISPFRAERDLARARFAVGEFHEVFVDVPLALAESRDPKGLYAKARAGQLPNFTGIDSAYEPPGEPELHLDAGTETLTDMAARVLAVLGPA